METTLYKRYIYKDNVYIKFGFAKYKNKKTGFWEDSIIYRRLDGSINRKWYVRNWKDFILNFKRIYY